MRLARASPRLTLARNGIGATTQVVPYRTAISTSRNSYKMGLREFLSIPKLRRRTKSKARSEIGPIEGPSTVDPPEPRLTGSTPDLRIGSSASATRSPLTSPGQESEGMKSYPSRMIHLKTFLPCNTDGSNPNQLQPAPNERQSQYPGSSNITSEPSGVDRGGSNSGAGSGDKNEIPSQSNVVLLNPRLMEPTPAPGVGSASFPTPHPSTSHAQGFKGKRTG